MQPQREPSRKKTASAEVWRLRGVLERIARGEGCRADLLAVETLIGGKADE